MMKKFVSVCLALALCLACAPAALAAGMGDVADNDNEVTVSDARFILRAAVGLENFSGETAVKADMDLDGEITVSDARLALRAAVGLERLNGETYENQLAVLAGDNYYADVTIRETEGEIRMVTAKTADSSYVSGQIMGIPLTILITDGNVYFLDKNIKQYCNLTEFMKELEEAGFAEGYTSEELQEELSSVMDFPALSQLPSLEKAEKSASEYNGEACDCYTVTEPSGVTRIYMRGPRLLAVITESRHGEILSSIEVNGVSPAVSTECTQIPSSYEQVAFDAYLEALYENHPEIAELLSDYYS